MPSKPHHTASGVEKVDLDRDDAQQVTTLYLRGKDTNKALAALDDVIFASKGEEQLFYKALSNALLMERTSINRQLEVLLKPEIDRLRKSAAKRKGKSHAV